MRNQMVERQIRNREIIDPKILDAMRNIPRHAFVPQAERSRSYEDCPLPIGLGQTISQPYMVARNAELLALTGCERVLEIGAGCGYQAAVLGAVAGEVFAIEWFAALAERAHQTLLHLRIRNVHVRQGDGKLGWPEQAPFDKVLVSCAVKDVCSAWWEQLKVGGTLVFPQVVPGGQALCRWSRGPDAWEAKETLFSVHFVPLL